MVISEKTQIDGQEYEKTPVLMSRQERLGEWIKNSNLIKPIIGENYERMKYWKGLAASMQGGIYGFALSGGNPLGALGGALGLGAIGYGLTKWLEERNTIGHRLAPVKTPVSA